MMCRYFEESPYATKRGLSGEGALIEHFRHRQELELRISREIFKDRYSILRSKTYSDDEVI